MKSHKPFFLIVLALGLWVSPAYVHSQINMSDDPTPGEIVVDRIGTEMVYVPSGTVQMGIDEADYRALVEDGIFSEFTSLNTISNEAWYGVFETYEAEVHGFWIDRYELTVDDYERIHFRCFEINTCSNSKLPQLLTWVQAVSWCADRGARLATEEEWEYAASGPENNIFPWGNDLDFDIFDNQDYVDFDLYEVGSRAKNVSWIGIYDMVGNAEEWTDDRFEPYYQSSLTEWYSSYNVTFEYLRVLRGGAAEDSILVKTTYARRSGFDNTAGVRCARISSPLTQQ